LATTESIRTSVRRQEDTPLPTSFMLQFSSSWNFLTWAGTKRKCLICVSL